MKFLKQHSNIKCIFYWKIIVNDKIVKNISYQNVRLYLEILKFSFDIFFVNILVNWECLLIYVNIEYGCNAFDSN